MGALLRRWRRWLLGAALGLAAIGVALWLASLSPDESQVAFDRVQVGMTESEVQGVMEGNVWKHHEQYGYGIMRNGVLPADYRYLVTYWFGFRKVPVVFDSQHRVVDKSLVRYLKPTFLDMLRLGVKRFRAALGV
jgi:hypothetical protein